MTPETKSILCAALNKLIWKCPVPEIGGVSEWANFWLGELRNGPPSLQIHGIEWDDDAEEFIPTTKKPQRCINHHFACDCRETRFRNLLEEVIRQHSDPGSAEYNECDKSPCAWCLEAKALIYHGRPNGVL